MAKQIPHYLVDGYNLIYVWKEFNSYDMATRREFLIRNLHEYSAYAKLEMTLVFDAARTEDEYRIESYDDFFRIIYSEFNESADNIIEKLSYVEARKNREVHVVSSDAIIENIILGAGAYRHPSREFYRAIKRAKKYLSKKYLDAVTLPVIRNEIADRVNVATFTKLEKLRRSK